MTAHIDNFGYMLDSNRTDFHASHAGCAGPQCIIRDDPANHCFMVRCFFLYSFVSLDAGYAEARKDRLFTDNGRTLDEKRFLDPQDDLFGKQWLAGIGSRADRVTATAFGAGVAI